MNLSRNDLCRITEVSIDLSNTHLHDGKYRLQVSISTDNYKKYSEYQPKFIRTMELELLLLDYSWNKTLYVDGKMIVKSINGSPCDGLYQDIGSMTVDLVPKKDDPHVVHLQITKSIVRFIEILDRHIDKCMQQILRTIPHTQTQE